MRSGIRDGVVRGVLAGWAAIVVSLNSLVGSPFLIEINDPNEPDSAFGTLTVVKVLVPADDTGLFDLWIGDEVVRADASDGDSGSRDLAPGDYTVFELAGTSTDLSDYDAEIVCDNGPTGSPPTAIVTIDSNDDVTCTITNTRRTEPPISVASPTPTPEGTQAGGTGAPAPSIPNTAVSLPGSGSLATLLFGTILIGSLGALALANARGVPRRSWSGPRSR
jgi:hypothetical protein